MWASYHRGYSAQSGRTNEVYIEASQDYGFIHTKFTKQQYIINKAQDIF